MFNKYKKSIILICLISFLGIFVFKVNNAQALSLISFSYEVIGWIFARIAMIMQGIASLFLLLAGMLMEIAFGLEKFTDAPVVKIGWQLTRDLVNMFFILVLLVIAFATILRREGYGIKKLLPKLIIVALLINFSLVICGTIIDFTQVGTHFFYDEIITADIGISGRLAGAFGIQRTFQIDEDPKNRAKQFSAGISGVIMLFFSIFTGTILILIAAISIALGAFFMITRLIWLWILLIMAPLAWFAWILPGTAHYARDWWSKFLKWAFFAPIYTFFIWLAVQSAGAGSFANIINEETNNIIESSGFKATAGNALLSTPRFLLQFICVAGILIGGLIFAEKTGVYGANGVMSLVKSGGNSVSGWVKRRAKETATRPFSKTTSAIGRRLERSGIWGTSQLARPFRAMSETGRATTKESIESYEKTFKNYTDENLQPQIKVGPAEAKIAAAKVLSSRGKLKPDSDKEKFGPEKTTRITPDDIEGVYKIAKKYDMHKELLKSNLNMCEKMGEDPYEIMKSMKKADMEKISLSGIIDSVTKEIVPDVKKAITDHLTKKGGALNKGHLSELSKNNFSVFEKIQNDIIEKEILPQEKWKKVEENRPDITSYLASDAGKALFHEVVGGLDWLEKEKKEKKEKGKKPKIISSNLEEEFQKAKA